MRITKSLIIQTASDLADANGLNQVTLKNIAEKLGIRTPSLYNHIESLEDLLRESAHNGMKAMNDNMMQAAIGKSGCTAIQAIAWEYFHFVLQHPGVYEIIQWATWHGNEKTNKIWEQYTELLKTLILFGGFQETAVNDITDLLSGILHGYTTLQLRHALNAPETAQANLYNTLETVLLGMDEKYRK